MKCYVSWNLWPPQFQSTTRDFILGGFSALCADHKSSPYIVCFRLSSPALINTELIPFVLTLANAQTLQMVFFSPEHSGLALDSHTVIYTENASGQPEWLEIFFPFWALFSLHLDVPCHFYELSSRSALRSSQGSFGYLWLSYLSPTFLSIMQTIYPLGIVL